MSMVLDADAWDRQRRISGWSQPAVSESKCVVFGAGALGNEVCKLLLQLGVNALTIVDFDTVSVANLNRCVFFTKEDAHAGSLKAEGIAREGKKVHPRATRVAECRPSEELPDSFYARFDVAFGCLDNLGARVHANAHCYGALPYIDGGTTGFSGKVQVVRSPSACVECGLTGRDYKLLWKKYSCVGEVLNFVEPAMPALPTTTSLVASVQVNEFIKLAHQKFDSTVKFAIPQESLVGKYLFFNGLTGEARVLSLDKRASCPVHA